MVTKRVESLRAPCLDVGSTPTTSTSWRDSFDMIIKRVFFCFTCIGSSF